MDDENRRRLRLLPGGRRDGACFGSVEVTAAPADAAPYLADAVVAEDDCYGVLASDPRFRPTEEHPVRIWTELKELQPTPPGTLVVREGRPLSIRAVVHDLSLDPTWKEDWIASALDAILSEVASRELGSLALAPLGAVHGKLPPGRFVALLGESIDRNAPECLQRVWIVAPAGRLDELRAAVNGPGRGALRETPEIE